MRNVLIHPFHGHAKITLHDIAQIFEILLVDGLVQAILFVQPLADFIGNLLLGCKRITRDGFHQKKSS
ncbi:hypothetical protein D3C71_2133170 [compost metagenome]